MWYFLFRFIFLVLLKLLFFFKVEGRENIPQKANFIAVANHTSFLDPIAVGVAIPQRIYWLAFRGLHNIFWLNWFLKITGTLPTGSASEKAVYLLNQNKNVGLFPEGTRSKDGKIREFRRGAALLARKTGRPILPCAIFGAHRALPTNAKWPRLFSQVKIKIGRPFYILKEEEEVIDDILLQEGMLKIKHRIEEMLYAG